MVWEESGVSSVGDRCRRMGMAVSDQCQIRVRCASDRCKIGVRSVSDQCQIGVRSVSDQYQIGVRSVSDQLGCGKSLSSPLVVPPTRSSSEIDACKGGCHEACTECSGGAGERYNGGLITVGGCSGWLAGGWLVGVLAGGWQLTIGGRGVRGRGN